MKHNFRTDFNPVLKRVSQFNLVSKLVLESQTDRGQCDHRLAHIKITEDSLLLKSLFKSKVPSVQVALSVFVQSCWNAEGIQRKAMFSTTRLPCCRCFRHHQWGHCQAVLKASVLVKPVGCWISQYNPKERAHPC